MFVGDLVIIVAGVAVDPDVIDNDDSVDSLVVGTVHDVAVEPGAGGISTPCEAIVLDLDVRVDVGLVIAVGVVDDSVVNQLDALIVDDAIGEVVDLCAGVGADGNSELVVDPHVASVADDLDCPKRGSPGTSVLGSVVSLIVNPNDALEVPCSVALVRDAVVDSSIDGVDIIVGENSIDIVEALAVAIVRVPTKDVVVMVTTHVLDEVVVLAIDSALP